VALPLAPPCFTFGWKGRPDEPAVEAEPPTIDYALVTFENAELPFFKFVLATIIFGF
jgi:hypothetical protein